MRAICVLHTYICLTSANSLSCSITSVRVCVEGVCMCAVCTAARQNFVALCPTASGLSGVWLHCFSNCFTGATNLNTNAPAPVCNNKIKCHSMPHVASCVGILSHTDGDMSRATARTWRRKSFKKLMPRTFQFVAPAFLPLKQLRGKCR